MRDRSSGSYPHLSLLPPWESEEGVLTLVGDVNLSIRAANLPTRCNAAWLYLALGKGVACRGIAGVEAAP